MGGNILSRLESRSPLKLKHLAEGVSVNLRALRNDKVFMGFILTSGASLVLLLANEIKNLRRYNKSESSDEKKTQHGRGSGGLKNEDRGSAKKSKEEKKNKKRKKPGLNKTFWRRFYRILHICVPGPTSGEAALLGVQFLLLVMRALITVRIFRINTVFLTQAISKASFRRWGRWVVNMIAWLVMGTFTNAFLKYVESLCGLRFRKRLTAHIHSLYMKNRGYYRLSAGAPEFKQASEEGGANKVISKGSLDHVDQRIAEDVRVYCDKLAHLYGHSFKPILEFSMIIGSTLRDLGASRIIALFTLLTVVKGILQKLTPNISAMVAEEQSAEGSFRHQHSRLRSNAEAVAFLEGGKAEERILNKSFGDLYRLRSLFALKRLSKHLADQFFKFQGIIWGGVFIHVPFLLRPEMTPSARISAFRACEVLMLKSGAAFSEIMLLSKNLQTLAGFASRIGELLEALGDDPKAKAGEGPRANSIEELQSVLRKNKDRKEGGGEKSCIEFKGVSVGAPEPSGDFRVLVEDLDLKVCSENVLVTGPNGCGKTSLFRVLAGLWSPIKGQITRPEDFVMWLPQDPYLVTGSLRDQVTYPEYYGPHCRKKVDERVRDALGRAGLEKVLQRSHLGLDKVCVEWKNELSGGERQRMAFARLFFHNPRYAVLDEATSAVNAEGELELYKQLTSCDCTVFSIAHRHTLRKFHSLELEFAGDGSGKYKFYKLANNEDEVVRSEIASSSTTTQS